MFSALLHREDDDLTLETKLVPLYLVRIVEKANYNYLMQKHIYEYHPDWVDSWEWLKEFSTT